MLNPCLALLACGIALAGFEAAWSGIVPPIFASPVFAGLGVTITGLAALLGGALYVVRRSDSLADHSRALASFEVASGCSAVIAFYLLAGIEQPYAALNGGLRGAACATAIGLALVFVIIFVPCFLAGAALALSLGPARMARPRAGFHCGLAAVFLGLAAGSVISGFLLMPGLGAGGTALCAAGAMVAAGVFSLTASRLGARRLVLDSASDGDAVSAAVDGDAARTTSLPGSTALLSLTGVLAASAVTCALAWTRVCQQAAGPTPHTTAAIATVLLASVGVGLIVAGRFERHAAGARHWIGLGAVAAGAVWIVPLYFVNDLPFLFLRTSNNYFALALAVFLIPGFFLGAALALTVGALWHRGGTASRPAAACYAVIVAGVLAAVILGLLAPSRLITLKTVAGLAPWPAIALGVCVAAWGQLRSRRLAATGLVAVAALAASLAAPAWNQGILTSGVYTYAESVNDIKRLRATLEGADVVYRSGDRGRIISVLRSPDGLFLREDGATIASTSADVPAQMLAAHIPLAICQDPRRVLVLGLGTGIAVGSAGSHPVERIDCVEPFPAVAAAARHFAPYNRQALADPRVNLVIREPANYLLLSGQAYDVIVSRQILASEIVRLARARLSPSGVFCQMIDLNNLSEEGAKFLTKEVAAFFPYVGLWWVGGSRMVITGSMTALKVESEVLRDRLAEAKVVRDLNRLETVNDVGLLSFYLMGREGLLAWTAYVPSYSRGRAFLVYHTPSRRAARDNPGVMAELDRRHEDPTPLLAEVDPENVEYMIISSHIGRATAARSSYFRSLAAARDGELREASAYIENARSNCPENGLFLVEASDFYVSASRLYAQGNKSVEALDAARRAVELRPGNPRAYFNLATVEIKRDPVMAAALLKQATELDPAYLPAYLLQAEAELAAGRLGPASETLSKALSLAPFSVRAYHLRGICSLRGGRTAEARADFERVAAAEPRNAAALSAIAYTWLVEEDLKKAQEFYQKALAISPDDVEALNNLATVLAEREQYRRAAKTWEKALRLDPDNQGIKANLEEVRQRMSGS
jgi:spermidine synthase